MQKKSDREKRATVKTSEVEVADYTKPFNEYQTICQYQDGPQSYTLSGAYAGED